MSAHEEDAFLVFRKDGEGSLVEEDLAAVVKELDNAKQVVLEGWHELAVTGRKGGQVEVGGLRGGVDAAGGVDNEGCGGVWIDVPDEGG